MTVFGVDPGTVITGYGIIRYSGNEVSWISSGIIKPPPADDMANRITFIYENLEKELKFHTPDEFAIETSFYGKNVQSALKIGYVRGVSLLAAVKSGIQPSEYSPREVKKAVVGKGSASKQQVQYMVQKLLGIGNKKLRLDESDALAIAICHAFKLKSFTPRSSSWKDFIESNPDRIVG